MSEWTSVIAVYWVLWAIDGLKLARARGFAIVGGQGPGGARVRYDRWLVPAILPGSWRLTTADVPVALAPMGLGNQPVASTGRPAESPSRIQAWRWEDVREAGIARGWIWINGEPFCPDTGHVTPAQLLQLAKLALPAREARIASIMRGWFRPAHLRRRVTVLAGRTRAVVTCNIAALLITAAVSVYVLADVASRLAEERAAAIALLLPYVVAAVFILHVVAVALAARARRHLKRCVPGFRSPGLLSPAMLPPQALRLRALLGEHFFPATHPLAAIVAFADEHDCEQAAFQTLADARWPMPTVVTSALSREVAAWFRAAIDAELIRMDHGANLSAEKLLHPPLADSPASRCYCPRCRSQFLGGTSRCPHGIALRPLAPVASNRQE